VRATPIRPTLVEVSSHRDPIDGVVSVSYEIRTLNASETAEDVRGEVEIERFCTDEITVAVRAPGDIPRPVGIVWLNGRRPHAV